MRRWIRHGVCFLLCTPLLAIVTVVGPSRHAAAATCSPPTPDFTTLTGVSFSSASAGIAVGAQNIAGVQPVAYQTTDGTNWTPLTPICAEGGLAAVSTPDGTHAWIAGFYRNSQSGAKTPLILTSTDGGATWAPQSSPSGVDSLTGIHFLNDNAGWAVGIASGGGAAVIHTRDGGATWSPLPAPVGLVGLDALAVVDAIHVDVVGYAQIGSTWQPEIATSGDAGTTWAEHQLGGPASASVAMSLSFVNPSDGWVTGLNSHEAFIGRTTDGGTTWSYAPDAPFARYHGVSFADASHGWVVGTDAGGNSSILASADGGANWSAQTPPPHGLFDAVTALSPAHAVAVGHLGDYCLEFAPAIAVTTDGGSTWNHQLFGRPPLPVGDLPALAFSGAHGLSVGSGQCRGEASAVSSADGGQTWRSLSIPAGVVSLSDVAFPDASHGWSVGTAAGASPSGTPTVLATGDAGRTWAAEQLPAAVSGASLDAISFVDSSHGWVVGSVILATVDGGNTWVQQTVPPGVTQLHDVHFVSATQGWAVGVNGSTGSGTAVVITTPDGGVTWTPETLPAGMVSASGVDFVNATTGWVVGSGGSGAAGVIFSTVNGGILWTQEATPAGSYSLADVSFSGTLDGWAVGTTDANPGFTSAVILSTVNGGVSWASRSAPSTAAALEGVVTQSATSACASGLGPPVINSYPGAALICTTDAGVTWHDVLKPNPPPEIPEASAAALLVGVVGVLLIPALRRRLRHHSRAGD